MNKKIKQSKYILGTQYNFFKCKNSYFIFYYLKNRGNYLILVKAIELVLKDVYLVS